MACKVARPPGERRSSLAPVGTTLPHDHQAAHPQGRNRDAGLDSSRVTPEGSFDHVRWRILVFGFDGLKVGSLLSRTRRKE